MAGRKPKPVALKLAQGNPGKRPLPEEPNFGGDLPVCPPFLDAQAKAEWNRIMGELNKVPGLVQAVDQASLAAYCVAWSELQSCEKDIKRKGRFIRVHGQTIPNPSLSRRDRAMDQIRKFASEFGFTPASRSRVSQPKASPASALKAFLDEEYGQSGAKAG